MSLIHWWPLNGNLNNKGLSNVFLTNSGATINSAGKIGSCYQLDGTDDYLQGPSFTVPSSGEFSVAGWYYHDGNNTWGRLFEFTNQNVSGITTAKTVTGLACGSNGSTLTSFDGKNATGTANKTWLTLTVGTWYHWVLVFNGTSRQLFINGVSQGTTTYASFAGDTFTYTFFGKSSWTSDKYLKGYLNDIRIYDHALSAKEVKEISKSLVLHYNFEDACNSNLLINSGNYTVLNKAMSNLSTADGYKSWPIYFNSLQDVTTYTLSVDFDGLLASAHGAPKDPTMRYCTMWLYFRTNPYSNSDYSSYDRPICFTSANYNHKQISATRHQWTFTLGSDITYYACCAIRTNTYSDGSTPVVVNFWNFKLEKSNTSTPFISNIDTNNTIYDSSGYGYNGTNQGNIEIISLSALGRYCAKFEGNASDRIFNTDFPKFNKNITFNVWCYQESSSSPQAQQFIVSQGRDYPDHGKGFNIISVGGNACVRGGGFGQLASNVNIVGAWHMVTGTYDGANVKVYVDGILKNTAAYTGDLIYGDAWNAPALVVGKMAHNYTSDTYYFMFNGKIADVKIYATALSASDILAEYNRKASIDRDGNFYGDEFVEEDGANTSIGKTGVTNTNIIATTMTLDDGSIWIPICMHYVPDGLNTSRSNKYCYTSRNIWNTFGIINDAERPESGYYEFYVMQQPSVNGAFSWFRFKQNINPFSATWNDVNPSKVGANVIRVSASTTNSYAGMYWMNNSGAAMCFANGSSGSWYGCGIQTAYQGGIPGYNGQTVLGWQVVYMRITKTCAKMFKNGLVIVNNIIEN